jgi:putative serine/threonine protein kinase
MRPSFLPISRLSEEPHSYILGYPSATKTQIRSRIVELKKLGIRSVAFVGPMLIGNSYVLGKGYTGIVVLAKMGTRKVALKIRRTDSPRRTMGQESILLKAANKVRVGPKLIASSKNFVVMEFLDGKKIQDWVSEYDHKNINTIKSVIRKVLYDCHKLDTIGLDHGELSYISKHVIVGKKVTIIDFESSSLERRTSNVTSASQGLYIGSGLAKSITRLYAVPQKSKIIEVLRQYKLDPSKESFERVIKVLKL